MKTPQQPVYVVLARPSRRYLVKRRLYAVFALGCCVLYLAAYLQQLYRGTDALQNIRDWGHDAWALVLGKGDAFNAAPAKSAAQAAARPPSPVMVKPASAAPVIPPTLRVVGRD